MNRRRAWWIFVVVLLSGCAGGDMSDLHRFVEEVKAREPGQIDPLPEIKQIETFVYVAGDRREPFSLGQGAMQETMVESGGGIAPNPLRRKEELEQFPLDSIRMMGTLEQDDMMWALVRVQDGTLFRVHAGNYMGQNHGQITRIGEEGIELTEIVPDGMGGWQERQAQIALNE